MAKQSAIKKDKQDNKNSINNKSNVDNSFLKVHQQQLILFALTILNLVVYGRAIYFKFISFDDKSYVYDNLAVKLGLNSESIKWAFTTFTMGHWHPLTWLSYMFNTSAFGFSATSFHAINIAFHLINTVLIFLVLNRLTKQFWPTAFVTALFAVHPLNVEPVVWIAARKDLLATMFGLLTILSYQWYTEKISSISRYLIVILMYGLSVMSKSSMLSLPFLLLLLDYWPLNRLRLPEEGVSLIQWIKGLWPLVREKLPLFVIVAITLIIAIKAQGPGTVVLPEYLDKINREYPLSRSIKNSLRGLDNYCVYLVRAIWPVKLAAYYPYEPPPIFQALFGAGTFLVGFSLFIFANMRRFPYIFVGWFWFVGMLLPSSWLLQADRYTYLPLVGVFIMVAWAASEFITRKNINRKAVTAVALALIAVLSIVSWRQLSRWRDSITLYSYILSVTKDNLLVHYNMGLELSDLDRLDEAAKEFAETVALQPRYGSGYCGLGNVALRSNNTEEAIKFYRQAVEANQIPEAYYGLARALYIQGDVDQAIDNYKNAIDKRPQYAEAYSYLGVAQFSQGNQDEAMENFKKGLTFKPDSPELQFNYGNALLALKRYDEAIAFLNSVKQARPDIADVYNNLGIALTEKQQYAQAITNYQQAIKIKPEMAQYHFNYANPLVRAGRKAEAIKELKEALRLNANFGEAKIKLQELEKEMEHAEPVPDTDKSKKSDQK